MIRYELQDWIADCKVALEIYRAIRRKKRLFIDRDKNYLELSWYGGARKTMWQRVEEHRANLPHG